MNPTTPLITRADPRRFEILDELGRGGFGVVYKARLSAGGGFRKVVAIKVLNRELTASSEAAVRLRDEARMLGLLRHPALVQVDGLVEIDGGWAVVMEYVPGADLNTLLRQGPVPARPSAEIVAAVAYALDSAWRTPGPQGAPLRLIHRDVKPANIRVTPEGAVKLLDFGIARAEFDARELTKQTGFIGTIGYMAPERLEGTDGPEGDVYALGCVLYQLLTREAPFRAAGERERHQPRVQEATGRLSAQLRGPAADLAEVVASCLAFDRTARPTARELALALDDLADTMGGPKLRHWGVRTISEAPAGAPSAARSALVELSADTFQWVEPGAAPRGTPAGPEPSPASPARSSTPLLVVGLTLGLGVVVLCALVGAALWWTRPAVEGTPVATTLATSTEPTSAAPAGASEGIGLATAPPTPEASKTSSPSTQPPVTSTTSTGTSESTSARSRQGRPERSTGVRVAASGDVKQVELVARDGVTVRLPGDVSPGSYTIRATFTDGLTTTIATPLVVRAGSAITLSCTASPFYTCSP